MNWNHCETEAVGGSQPIPKGHRWVCSCQHSWRGSVTPTLPELGPSLHQYCLGSTENTMSQALAQGKLGNIGKHWLGSSTAQPTTELEPFPALAMTCSLPAPAP